MTGRISAYLLPAAYRGIGKVAVSAGAEFIVLEVSTTSNPAIRRIGTLDATSGALSLVATNQTGAVPHGSCWAPALDARGKWLVFLSDADDLVPEVSNHVPNIYRRDMESGEIVLVTHAGDGSDTIGVSNPVFSDDGSTILFTSRDQRLVKGMTGVLGGLFAAESRRLGFRLDAAPSAGLKLSWYGSEGVQYRLQYREQADSGDWINGGPIVQGAGALMEADAPLDRSGNRYFRIRELP